MIRGGDAPWDFSGAGNRAASGCCMLSPQPARTSRSGVGTGISCVTENGRPEGISSCASSPAPTASASTATPCWRAAHQGGEVYADDYARALTGSKIGLGLLRKVCPDQHTTRTFEIPACGSLLLADRTDEHQELFEEGNEAEFFASDEELLDKVNFYRVNERTRERVTRAGYERCSRGEYAYVHRLRYALEAIEQV